MYSVVPVWFKFLLIVFTICISLLLSLPENQGLGLADKGNEKLVRNNLPQAPLSRAAAGTSKRPCPSR